MVATFNNYQELVDRALMIEGKQQQIDNARGSLEKGSTTLELIRSHVLPQIQEDIFSIPMEQEVRTTIVDPRMVMGMEEATDRTVPTQQCPPRKI